MTSSSSEFNSSLSPSEIALARIVEGNQRYVQDKLLHPNRSQESREAVMLKQEPFAIVVGCSDSRVSPEILFDQGIGDLFVVRVAGNVVGPIELDSIEYSAVYLHSSVILIMGHESCGAVRAVIDKQTLGIESVASIIEPAVNSSANMPGDKIENAVKTNVMSMVKQVKESPLIAKLVSEGKIDVVGGYYHLSNGEVEILR